MHKCCGYKPWSLPFYLFGVYIVSTPSKCLGSARASQSQTLCCGHLWQMPGLVTKPDCWAPLIASCKIGCAKRLHCTWVKFVKACSWMMHAHRRRPLQIHHSWVQGPLMFSYVLHSVYSFACSRMMWPKNIFKKRIFYVFSTCFRYCCIVELYF